jgi:hypothetical protein
MDIISISLFGGASCILLVVAAFFIFIPSTTGDPDYIEIVRSMPVIRVAFILTYIVFASGLVMQTLQSYGINYFYIFELDPHHKITQYQLYKISMIMFFIMILSVTFTLIQVKLDHYFVHDPPVWGILLLSVLMVFYCCQPCFRCGYRTARKQLGITIIEILKAPFGKVRFRDFFFADIITSMVEPLKDFGAIIFFTATLESHQDNAFARAISVYLPYYITVVCFLPFWWRFWQCINKYFNHNSVPQLYNAGKYFSKLIPPFIVLFYANSTERKSEGFYLWVTF